MIDWELIRHFKKEDFVDDPHYADPELLYSIEQARILMAQRMYPSTVRGTLCRFGGSKGSQHYVGPHRGEIVRKATASDMFIEGVPMQNLLIFLGSGLFKGIGLYLDTIGVNGRPWVMTHLDIRKNRNQPLVWLAYKEKGKTQYVYSHDPRFLTLIQDRRLFEPYRYRYR